MLIEKILSRKMRRMCRKHFQRTEPASRPPEPSRSGPSLLYLHIPFCESLCPYCSFNRIQFDQGVADRYYDALNRELLLYSELGHKFNAIYVGGGTPTVAPDRMVETIGRACELWAIKEVSVETNANHLTPRVIQKLQSAGVNRLSVGIQTFDNDLLRLIERYDMYGSGEDMQTRIASALGTFKTLNMDMIFNIPGQSIDSLAHDLAIINETGPDQVTFYPFMATHSVKQHRALKNIDLRNEKRMYNRISSALMDRYKPASAWCFSRTDDAVDEYVVSHDNYAGLGAGSFGYIDGVFYVNTFDIPAYIDSLNAGKSPVIRSRALTHHEKQKYVLLMRLFSGTINTSALITQHGPGMSRLMRSASMFLTLSGSARRRGSILQLTQRGRYYLLVLMREFFTCVDEFRANMLANL